MIQARAPAFPSSHGLLSIEVVAKDPNDLCRESSPIGYLGRVPFKSLANCHSSGEKYHQLQHEHRLALEMQSSVSRPLTLSHSDFLYSRKRLYLAVTDGRGVLQQSCSNDRDWSLRSSCSMLELSWWTALYIAVSSFKVSMSRVRAYKVLEFESDVRVAMVERNHRE